MEFSFAFFAEAAQITSDGRLNLLGADLHTIQFQGDPPWMGGMYVVLGIQFENQEGGRLYHLTGDLLAPDGSKLPVHMEQDFVAPVPEAPDRIPRMNLVAYLLGVPFPVAGAYHLELKLEDRERSLSVEKRVRLRVNGPPLQKQNASEST